MVSECCNDVSLRTRSIILAVFGILHGFINLVLPFWLYIHFWFYIVFGFLHIFGYSTLLHGARKHNKSKILKSLAMSGVTIGVGIVFAIIHIVYITIEVVIYKGTYELDTILEKWTGNFATYDLLPTKIGTTSGVVVSVIINIFFWKCNYSYSKVLNYTKEKRRW
jgi:hypothetical protein